VAAPLSRTTKRRDEVVSEPGARELLSILERSDADRAVVPCLGDSKYYGRQIHFEAAC
jgi:hypothetical protein